MSRFRGLGGRAALALASVLILPIVALAESNQRVIVRAAKPYTSVSALVASLGGRVDYQYENVDAVAVTIPASRLADLSAAVGPEAITKDNVMAPPRPLERVDLGSEDGLPPSAIAADAVTLATASPLDYSFNNALIGATALHAAGQTGANVTVAIIDSGTTNSAAFVPALTGSVIGGENFVAGATEPSATSHLNGDHGTWVGTVIAGHVIFGFNNTSTLVRSLKAHAPTAVLAPCPPSPPTVGCGVRKVGGAPSASL
jgi:hypothetical protein